MEETTLKPQVSFYKKQNSFETVFSRYGGKADYELARSLRLLDRELADLPQGSYRMEILSAARGALTNPDEDSATSLKVSQFLADELKTLEDREVGEFWFHRYRYEVFPVLKRLDDAPPYLQIEPSSICNYRCVFCYQTDGGFSSRSSGMMGRMNFETFRRIIDMAEGKVQFLSLASRGEPTLCPDLNKMLEYANGKFLNLKVNTNASLLTEPLCHAILSGGVKTVVFSADAAEEPMYSQYRVGGKLEKVLKNIALFQDIREKHYPRKRLMTRVSGVKVSDAQNLEKMVSCWGEVVDQVAFVAYNPWESIYNTQPNGLQTPCTDLWRRMFVWYDGGVNPCDTDYKSTLKVGSLFNSDLKSLWRSNRYEALREAHVGGARQVIEPCKRCSLV